MVIPNVSNYSRENEILSQGGGGGGGGVGAWGSTEPRTPSVSAPEGSPTVPPISILICVIFKLAKIYLI